MNGVLAIRKGPHHPCDARFRYGSALKCTPGHKSTANSREYNGIEQRCIFRVERAVNEHGFSRIYCEITMTENRPRHLFKWIASCSITRWLIFTKCLGCVTEILQSPLKFFTAFAFIMHSRYVPNTSQNIQNFSSPG